MSNIQEFWHLSPQQPEQRHAFFVILLHSQSEIQMHIHLCKNVKLIN